MGSSHALSFNAPKMGDLVVFHSGRPNLKDLNGPELWLGQCFDGKNAFSYKRVEKSWFMALDAGGSIRYYSNIDAELYIRVVGRIDDCIQ